MTDHDAVAAGELAAGELAADESTPQPDLDELDPEAPEADLAEQLRPARDEPGDEPVRVPLEADIADVAEQRRVVELDDDEDR